jgi:hypothetical protein
MARAWLLLGLALLLVLPSANYQVFDGLPLARAPEFLALALLIPLLLGRGLRRLHERWMSRWPRPLRVALIAAAAMGLGLKVVLLASGTYQGFPACYRSPLEGPTTGPCERSFENPLFRFAVTRLDRAVHFGEHDWDLGFLNTIRFDRHYDGLQGRLRRRLPIEASWRGAVERPRPWVARVTYVGEATIRLDPDGPEAGRASTTLPPHYGAPATALVPVPGGRHDVRIDYRFDDGSTWGGPRPSGPWATLQVERGRGPEGRDPGPPITPIRPAWPWRALAAAGDAAVALLAISILLFYVGLLWRDAGLLVLVAVAAPLADRLDPVRLGLPGSLGLCLVLALVAGPLLGRRWRRRLVGAFFATLYVTWFVTQRTFRRLDIVTLRDWAGDPLFYESQARAILDTWSLEGGERIFVYQPLFRYIRFSERLLLGEGDGLVSLLGLAALYWALCWAIARLWARPAAPASRTLLFGGVAMFMLALVSTPPVVYFVQASLSEFPTWVFLLLLFPMLFASRSPVQWRAGSALASLSLLTRSNQAAGVLAQLGVFAWRTWSLRPRAALAALVLSALVLALPSLHNLYYGGQLVLAGRSQPHLLKLPPALWPRILHDPAVAKQALNQLDHVLYANPVDDPPPRGDALSRVAIRGLQVLWATACVLAIRRRGFAPGTKLLLVGLPVLYLGVHLVYVVDDYYPRHIIAGYLAMGLVTLNAVGRGWLRNDLSKPAA